MRSIELAYQPSTSKQTPPSRISIQTNMVFTRGMWSEGESPFWSVKFRQYYFLLRVQYFNMHSNTWTCWHIIVARIVIKLRPIFTWKEKEMYWAKKGQAKIISKKFEKKSKTGCIKSGWHRRNLCYWLDKSGSTCPAGNDLFKVKDGNARATCEMLCNWHHSSVFNDNFEHIRNIFLVFPLLNFNK